MILKIRIPCAERCLLGCILYFCCLCAGRNYFLLWEGQSGEGIPPLLAVHCLSMDFEARPTSYLPTDTNPSSLSESIKN
jgi:hypothetical protein